MKLENSMIHYKGDFMGKRESRNRASYNLDKYYRNQVGDVGELNNKDKQKKNKRSGWRYECGGGHDHQFYNANRLDELEIIEYNWNEYIEMGGDPDIHKRMRYDKFNDPTVPNMFTKHEELEYHILKDKGFKTWSKKDFTTYITAVIKFGKRAYTEISKEMVTKTPEEVRKYSHCFFVR